MAVASNFAKYHSKKVDPVSQVTFTDTVPFFPQILQSSTAYYLHSPPRDFTATLQTPIYHFHFFRSPTTTEIMAQSLPIFPKFYSQQVCQWIYPSKRLLFSISLNPFTATIHPSEVLAQKSCSTLSELPRSSLSSYRHRYHVISSHFLQPSTARHPDFITNIETTLSNL